jgi:hypothetical protein
VRDLVRTTPPADLRERTLAYVREHGRPRGPVDADTPEVVTTAPTDGARRTGRPARRIPAWAAAAAAVIALLVGSVGFLVGRADLDRYGNAVGALEAVNRATIEISGDPGARRVELASTTGATTAGTLLFSPSTTRLVVVAADLERPATGKEYRCWVEVKGQRVNVGRMFFAEELAFWVGDTPEVSGLQDGSRFGVSLTDVGGSSLDGAPVIAGEL